MNLIEIMGVVGADPESRFTQTGVKIITFNVVTNKKIGDKSIATWYKCVIWGERYDKFIAHVKKGTQLVVIGELQKPEIYTSKSGQQGINLEIHVDIVKFNPFPKPKEEVSKTQNIQSEGSVFGAQAQVSYKEEALPF